MSCLAICLPTAQYTTVLTNNMTPKRRFSFKIQDFTAPVIVILSCVMLAFSSGSFIVNMKTVGFSVLSSLENGVHTVVRGAVGAFTAIRELKQLQKDFDALTRRLENYEQMQRSNADIRKENERLKEQLGFVTSLEQKSYPAQIIARDSDNLYAYLTVNKGSAAGIKKNMPVIAYQNGTSALVGKVVQVGMFTCLVIPVYNLNCTVSARIQNTRDLGLVTGNGSPDKPLTMLHIRKRVLEELHYGDMIVTSGENNNYMSDLPLGSISKITTLDYNSSLSIEVAPIIDFSRLENVVIVNLHEINTVRPLEK